MRLLSKGTKSHLFALSEEKDIAGSFSTVAKVEKIFFTSVHLRVYSSKEGERGAPCALAGDRGRERFLSCE